MQSSQKTNILQIVYRSKDQTLEVIGSTSSSGSRTSVGAPNHRSCWIYMFELHIILQEQGAMVHLLSA